MTVSEFKKLSVINQSSPFFKRHQLRWLYYRRLPNLVFSKGDYTSATRCKTCKKGSGMMWAFQGKFMCAGLDHEYIEEPNTSIKHRLFKVYKTMSRMLWKCLDVLHLVRSSHEGRYDMFGDEGMYVKSYTVNTDTCETTYNLRNRKWWEYMFILRK